MQNPARREHIQMATERFIGQRTAAMTKVQTKAVLTGLFADGEITYGKIVTVSGAASREIVSSCPDWF